MAPIANTAAPPTGLEALLNLIYDIKFSRHVPLTVILLSGVYAIYRSMHYFMAAFKVEAWVALPTAMFVELLVLGAGALVFITNRDCYLAELKKQDQKIAKVGAWASLTLLGVALAALVGIAWADAWMVTGQPQPSMIMTLVQLGQSGMIMVFIVTALLEERERLRTFVTEQQRIEQRRRANGCRYCGKPVTTNNRARHEKSCAMRPAQP